MSSTAYDIAASAMAGLFVWQAAFAIGLLAAAWLFARLQRKYFGFKLKVSKLFYWLSLTSFVTSSLPLGFYLGKAFHLEGVWVTAVSGGLTLSSIGKAAWDFAKKSQLPDVQKRLHQFVLCLVSLALGVAVEIAWRSYVSTPSIKGPRTRLRKKRRGPH